MKKPKFDSIDRWIMRTPTWIGRSLRRELKYIKSKRKIYRIWKNLKLWTV